MGKEKNAKQPHIELIARGVLMERGADGEHRLLVCVAREHTDSDGKTGYAFLPGGHVEFGEPAAVSLAREMVEECGVRVKVGALLLTHEATFKAKRMHHEVNVVFAMARSRRDVREPITSRESHIEFRFVTRGELRRLRLLPLECRAWVLKHWAALSPGNPQAAPWLSGVDGV